MRMFIRTLLKSLLLPLVFCTVLVGCSSPDKMTNLLGTTTLFYRPTIIQGDEITRAQLRQLQPGMTRQQVRAVLGSPVLQDSFHEARWDYVYTEGVGSEPISRRYLAVYFENDHLARVEGTMGTSEPDTAAEPKPSVVTVPDWQD